MNIDELSQETLWKLYAFISDGATDALPDAPNASAREKGNATDQVTFFSQCCHQHVWMLLPCRSHCRAYTMVPAQSMRRCLGQEVELLRWCLRNGAYIVPGMGWYRASGAQRGLSRPFLLLFRRMQPSRTTWATTSTHQQARPTLAAAVTAVSLHLPLHAVCIFCELA